MMNEEWKDIVVEKNGVIYDYSGLYQVSNFGRVRNSKGKIKKLNKHRDGHLWVGLWKDGKSSGFFVHRLVAFAFIPNPNNLPILNHRDENPSNNHVDNLEWCTQKYNVNYGTRNERVSKTKTGHTVSEEQKRKQSETLKQKYSSGEIINPNLGKPMSEEQKRKISKVRLEKGIGKGENNPRARAVICLETKQVFGCVKDAIEWCHGDVKSNCRGKTKYAGKHPITGEKLHWMYYDEWLAMAN